MFNEQISPPPKHFIFKEKSLKYSFVLHRDGESSNLNYKGEKGSIEVAWSLYFAEKRGCYSIREKLV